MTEEVRYPSINSKDFYEKIVNKKEYNETKYAENYYDTITIEEKCNPASFSVENHQIFLRRFMNEDTPYKSILLYHGVGTGKTCAAITIAEGFKKSIMSVRKRIKIKRGTRDFKYFNYPGVYIISGQAIHKVFSNELYNPNKVTKEEIPGISHCVGNEYFPINDDVESLANKMQRSMKIKTYYSMFGPSEFGNFVKDIKKVISLKEFFENSIFIVDEVHNVISEENEKTDSISTLETLKEIFQEAENTRLVMLTATPMRDDEKSIVNILTLLRYNNKNFDNIDIEKLFPSKDSTNYEYLKELFKGYVSYLRGNNPVSFPKIKKPSSDKLYKPNPRFKIDGSDYEDYDERIYDLFKCVMSEFQFEGYLKIKEKGLFPMTLWEALTIVYPSEEIGDIGFKNNFKENNNSYSYKKYTDFLLEENIQKYSSKIYELLKLSKEEGLHYIYSQYDKSGALTIALAFEANGYAYYSKNAYWDNDGKFVGGKSYLTGATKKYRCYYCGKLNTEDHSSHKFKQGTYLLFTGTTKIPTSMNVFNSIENKDGQLVKFMIGSQVSAEGVDYKRIKHLHIINPWHNFTRIWQAIGRGLRNCSQVDFPENERNVTIYLYSATPPLQQNGKEYQTETQDENSYALSLKKDIRIKEVERSLKEVAIDCSLNEHANKYASDKDYSRECDYMKCDYSCDYKEEKSELDTSTYTIKYNDPIIQNAKNLIFLLFKEKTYYNLQEILENINSIPKEYVYVALTQLLSYSYLKDSYSRDGYLAYKNGIYFYQPDQFNDESAPLQYKSTPLNYKVKDVKIQEKTKKVTKIIKRVPEKETMEDDGGKERIEERSEDISEQKSQERSNIENKLKTILLYDTIETISYHFDRNDNNSIVKMTELLLNKSKIKNYQSDKILNNSLLLLDYLNKTEFVLTEKYNESIHNSEIYQILNDKVFIGHINRYWILSKAQDIVKLINNDGTFSVSSDLIKNKSLRDDMKQNKKDASLEDSYLNGIVSYKTEFNFRIRYNPTTEAFASSDKRKQSRGKATKSYKKEEYEKFLSCLDKENNYIGLNIKESAKTIELLFRKYEYINKDNLKWLERQ